MFVEMFKFDAKIISTSTSVCWLYYRHGLKKKLVLFFKLPKMRRFFILLYGGIFLYILFLITFNPQIQMFKFFISFSHVEWYTQIKYNTKTRCYLDIFLNRLNHYRLNWIKNFFHTFELSKNNRLLAISIQIIFPSNFCFLHY